MTRPGREYRAGIFGVPIEGGETLRGAGLPMPGGPIMTMPGLGSLPAYRHIDINDDGDIVGLS